MRRARPIESLFEAGLFAARWLMAPFYAGLVVSLVLLLIVFARELIEGAASAVTSVEHAILLVLSLVDLSLAGNLVLIVAFSGYENFVSRIEGGEPGSRPRGLGPLDFSKMKMNLIASVISVSAISLLRAFLEISGVGLATEHPPPDAAALRWMLLIHGALLASAVLFAVTDWLSSLASGAGEASRSRAAGEAPH